jgi:hypothetical protein
MILSLVKVWSHRLAEHKSTGTSCNSSMISSIIIFRPMDRVSMKGDDKTTIKEEKGT